MSDQKTEINLETAILTEEEIKAKYQKAKKTNLFIIFAAIVVIFFYFNYQTLSDQSNLDYIEGNILKISRSGNASVGASWKNASLIGQLTYGALFKADAGFTEVNPDLAEKYEVSDDGLTYVITMKDNLKWSDGTDLTVDDVIWSIESFMRVSSVNSTILNAFNYIEGVDKWVEEGSTASGISGLSVEGNNVTIKLSSPFSSFPLVLSQFVILPEHKLKDEITEELLTSEFFKDPDWNVTSGMYRMDYINEDGDLELVQNEYYYGDYSDIERVIMYGDYQNMHIDHYSTTNITEMISYRSMTGFEEFNVDVNFYRYFVFNQAAAYEPPQIVPQVDEDGNNVLDEDGKVIMVESTEPNEYPVDRASNTVVQDVRVRQAILHAIDVPTLIKDVYYGTAKANYGGATTIAEQVYDYNPTKAKQLLEEAEYDFDYTFTIGYYHTDANSILFLNKVKAYLEDIGMNVELKRASGTVALYQTREYDMLLKALSAFNVDDWYGEYLLSNETVAKLLISDDFDELVKELFASGADLDRYREILTELVDLEQQLLYKVPMLTLDDAIYINANRLSVPEDMVFGNTRYRSDLRLDEWYIKKG